MATFFERLKSGFKAAAKAFGPGRFKVEGRTVQCPHCGNGEFAEGSALLNTVGMSFLGLDWTNRSAHTLMCSKCGRIEWFGQSPTRT